LNGRQFFFSHIDYFNLMAYDFKVYLDDEDEENKKIGHHSPLYHKSEQDQELSVVKTRNKK